MKFIKSLVVFFVMVLAQGSLSAQAIINITPVDKVISPGSVSAAPGTYQIIRMGIKSPVEVFTTDIYYLIEANRHASKDVVIMIGEFTKVHILPNNVISAVGFVPLSDQVSIEQ